MYKLKSVRNIIFKASLFLFVGMIFYTNSALALTQGDIDSIKRDTPFYRPNFCESDLNTSGSSTNSGDSTAATTGIWNSGIQAPYILEQYAIEVLKNVAQKRGVPETNTVTQEHVIGLLAFMRGEGGDIANQWLFNPLNTGINAPELVDGNHKSDGTQGFKSFDAGVEGTARTMVGSNQSRLADILIQPESNAQDFMEALTYYERYAGNKFWASASVADPNAYFKQRLQLIQTVRNDYIGTAALVIGTPEKESVQRITKPELLQFSGTGFTTGFTSADADKCKCTSKDGETTIVIDPGHSGEDTDSIDQLTGLRDHDFKTEPELDQVFEVATKVQTKLQEDGYSVVMTKNKADDTSNFRQKSNIANQANAALAISIHYDNGQNFSSFAEMYTQKVGLYRSRPDGSSKTEFTNADVATKSQEYAQIFQQTRQQAEGRAVSIKDNNFGGRDGIDPGNIPLIQLFANVPWVYHEVGGKSAGQASGLNESDIEKYANGLINGVEKAVPIFEKNDNNQCAGNGAVAGDIVQTAVNYSWPERGHGTTPKPEYAAAIAQYYPNAPFEGADCGSFVGTVMRATGADPNYPQSGTFAQEPYVRAHPELYDVVDSVSSTAELQPGDIMIANVGNGQGSNGHTYIYVGKQPNGMDSASASGGKRMPNLDKTGTSLLKDSKLGYYLRARLKK